MLYEEISTFVILCIQDRYKCFSSPVIGTHKLYSQLITMEDAFRTSRLRLSDVLPLVGRKRIDISSILVFIPLYSCFHFGSTCFV